MARRKIVGHAIAWTPGLNKPVAMIKLEGGKESKVPVKTAEELAALALILQESPVYLYDNGLIGTGWEEDNPS